MRNIKIRHISDSGYGGDHGSDNMSGPVLSPQYTSNLNTALPRSNLQTFAEKPPLSSTSSKQTETCVICNGSPAYSDGPNIYPTCGMACSSKLLIACGLPNTNEPRISDRPSMSSAPNIFDRNLESPRRSSELERTYTDSSMEMDGPYPTFGMAYTSKLPAAYDVSITTEPRASDPPNMSSAPNIFDKNWGSPRWTPEPTRAHADRPIEMCVICDDAPVYKDGSNTYPTCGMACASKLRATSRLPHTNRLPTSDSPNMSSAPNVFGGHWGSPTRTPEPTRTYADRRIEMCVICNDAPVNKDGSNIYSITCGKTCASILIAARNLSNINKSHTSNSPNMSSTPNVSDKHWETPRRTPEPTRTYADRSIEMCMFCNCAPVHRDGPNIYSTCGMECASKLQAASGRSNSNGPRTSDPPNMSSAPNVFDKNWESLRRTPEPTQAYTDRSIEMCVICNSAPVYRDGSDVYSTCGIACASVLQAACDLPNTNKPRTSDQPNMLSAPNIFDRNRESPRRTPEPTRTYPDTPIEMCVVCNDAPAIIYSTCGVACASKLQAGSNTNEPPTSDPPTSAIMSSSPPQNNADSITRSHSHPNQTLIGMCDVCHVRPRYQKEDKIYPTCGLSCAAKLQAPDSVEMCDYCKKRPKVIIEGKTYPQCGKTCRDKAKFAKTACILCQKSTKAGESDFCSKCQSLADNRAPFLIEIPRGHVAFEKVAEVYASEWQTSETHCPTIKKVYMVVMKKTFKKTFEKYSTKIGPRNILFKRKKCTSSLRWLVFLRECGFGDPGNLEPCTSNKCLMCSIVRSTFNHSDFPGGITTSGLNRTVELSRSGNESSSKIVAMTRVVVGREAEMSPHDAEVVRPLPPPNTDSVHVIGERNDGSRLDLGEIIVYDGDAVWPLYLISYDSE